MKQARLRGGVIDSRLAKGLIIMEQQSKVGRLLGQTLMIKLITIEKVAHLLMNVFISLLAQDSKSTYSKFSSSHPQ